MIKSEETRQKNTTGNLKDDVLFLLNYEIQSKNDEYILKKMDEKYDSDQIW